MKSWDLSPSSYEEFEVFFIRYLAASKLTLGRWLEDCLSYPMFIITYYLVRVEDQQEALNEVGCLSLVELIIGVDQTGNLLFMRTTRYLAVSFPPNCFPNYSLSSSLVPRDYWIQWDREIEGLKLNRKQNLIKETRNWHCGKYRNFT